MADVGRRLLMVAVIAVAAAAGVYLALVCTPLGQQLGDDILADRLRLDRRLRVTTQTALMQLTSRSLLVLALGVGAVALVRRRWRLAVAALVAVLGTAVVAEVLKVVLPRPDFGIDPPAESGNSLPSGHAAIAMALALAVIMVVPVAWRRWATVVGGAGAALVSAGAIVAGWHRPSDVVSGDLLAVAIAAVVCAVLVARRGGVPGEGSAGEGSARRRVGLRVGVGIAVVAPLVVAPAVAVAVPGGPDIWRAGTDVVVGVLVAVVAAVAVALTFGGTLGETELDPPAGLSPRPGTRRGRAG